MAYADYYEHALTNGVLNIQRCNEPVIMIYMLPQEVGISKIVLFNSNANKNKLRSDRENQGFL